ncbi:flagellar hook-associated protein FlgK [uncultured Litoreibacter sp.]|uniref:flagellar hook-associated protein FlgK n=1 Tax=uncultured Litoreibacter sp. TaxID=1392394 RepID=UPI00261DA599|nr:flagellar hook-associated protein FlgK [uncultured Litoreibacter sp.]
MSLTGALSAATSGLSAASRSAQLVSSNVANALTEGYGRRDIRLSSLGAGGAGGGVQVTGVDRVVDQYAIGQRRLASANFGQANQLADLYSIVSTVVGTPDDPTSLSARVAAFENSLISATASPESATTLDAAVTAARGIVSFFHSASDVVQETRESSDQQIHQQVQLLNVNLSAISDLNTQIRSQISSNWDPSPLMDERQRLIDEISEIVPLREIPGEYGRISLLTENGTILVGDHAATFEFEPTLTIVPEMTVQSGALSGLTLVGAESSVGSALEAISGGALAANFAIRDEATIELQEKLDALAQNLITRTSDATVDPTLGAGPGIFTDQGLAIDPANVTGIAARIQINSEIDPLQGGASWKLRDGVGATTQGPSGNISILSSIADALRAAPAGGSPSSPETASFASLAAGFESHVGTVRIQSETKATYASSQVSTFSEIEGRLGVDTDQEMQKLLVIEQSYAANAKIIQAVDEMMQSLLRI